MSSRAELLYKELMTGNVTANIERMVAERRQETEYLDFKNAGANDQKSKELWSKALSGFANTEGGVLIWGVDARKIDSTDGSNTRIDAANEVRPIANAIAFREMLVAYHREATIEPVSGAEIRAIADAGGRGYVVCYVPEGEYKPYRDTVSRVYWTRYQDSFVAISHQMLRSLFFPKVAAHFSLQVAWIDGNTFMVTLTNVGNGTAKDFGFTVRRPSLHAWNPLDIGLRVRQSVHPMDTFEVGRFQVMQGHAYTYVLLHLIATFENHAPQCFRIMLPNDFRPVRHGSAGFKISEISFEEAKTLPQG